MSEPFGSTFFDISRSRTWGEVDGEKTCYHIFIVVLLVGPPPGPMPWPPGPPGPSPRPDGWEVWHNPRIPIIGNMGGGHIQKICVCLNFFELSWLKKKFAEAGLKSGITSKTSGGFTLFSGYEITKKGTCPPRECDCAETIDLSDSDAGDDSGDGLDDSDSWWEDSSGQRHGTEEWFNDPGGLMQRIIDTERNLPCDCS